MTKRLNLRELLNFYDYRVPSSNTHASAVNAVLGENLAIALLVHYLKSLGFEVHALDEVCTQGTQRGSRLDKWLVVKSKEELVIYQVEIKNWSAHSIGGKSTHPDASDEEMAKFRLQRWRYQFNLEKQVPSQKETLKVLTKMRVPNEFSNYAHKALLCFWEPLHPEGVLEPLFEVNVASDAFKKMTVFSMSNYVSLLLKETDFLEVEMTDADARMNWLTKLYG